MWAFPQACTSAYMCLSTLFDMYTDASTGLAHVVQHEITSIGFAILPPDQVNGMYRGVLEGSSWIGRSGSTKQIL